MADAPTSTAVKVRRALPVVLFAGLLVGVAVVSADPESSGLPLDPRSTDADGTRALVLILEETGADVTLLDAPPGDDVDTLLVPVDNLGDASAAAVKRHAQRGGVLVVAGFGGALSPDLRPAGVTSFVQGALPRRCDIAALRDVGRLEVAPAPLFVVPDGATGCYRRGELAWLIGRTTGDGVTVNTGSAQWLTNRGMAASATNARLAVALLAPRPGTRVGILTPDFASATASGGASQETLSDLIPAWVKTAFVQLLVAFALVVVWRARRLGDPVGEPHVVRLPASDLVIAVGELMQRTGARLRAAALLRADLRHALSRRLGAGDDDAERLAETVAARTGVAPAEAVDVLAGPAPASDQELLELAQRVEELRRAALAPTSVRSDG